MVLILKHRHHARQEQGYGQTKEQGYKIARHRHPKKWGIMGKKRIMGKDSEGGEDSADDAAGDEEEEECTGDDDDDGEYGGSEDSKDESGSRSDSGVQ